MNPIRTDTDTDTKTETETDPNPGLHCTTTTSSKTDNHDLSERFRWRLAGQSAGGSRSAHETEPS